MKKRDIEQFIEEMETIGDEWDPEDVERVYGDSTLDEALQSRKADLDSFFGIIATIL